MRIMGLYTGFQKSLLPLSAIFVASPVYAEIPPLRLQSGDFDLRLTLGLAAQAGIVDDDNTTIQTIDDKYEARASASAKWTIASEISIGSSVKFANTVRESETLDAREIYGYVASKWGRIEIGQQDGPADTLSYAAPVIALGQIRGDFSRHAGSQALLKPLDTKDSPKIIYLSPKLGGLRAGLSWSPVFKQNSTANDPRSRVIVKNAVELSAQLERLLGGWKLGFSGGYVFGRADPITTRQNLDSWSIGARARRGPLRFGAAYVSRGESNRLESRFNQWEMNGGVAWVEDRWGVAASSAFTKSSERSNRLFGVGGFLSLNSNVQLRADFVRFREDRDRRLFENGRVALMELQLKI